MALIKSLANVGRNDVLAEPEPLVECQYCRQMVPDLSWHYAVGPNTCPEMAKAWDDLPSKKVRQRHAEYPV